MGLIYVDSCLLIYAVESSGRLGDAARAAFRRAEAGQLCISPLTMMECLVGPIRTGNQTLERRFRQACALFVQLDLPEPVFMKAAMLRARWGLKTPDAVHLACAQHHGCDALWTNDSRLARASHGMAIDALEAD